MLPWGLLLGLGLGRFSLEAIVLEPNLDDLFPLTNAMSTFFSGVSMSLTVLKKLPKNQLILCLGIQQMNFTKELR